MCGSSCARCQWMKSLLCPAARSATSLRTGSPWRRGAAGGVDAAAGVCTHSRNLCTPQNRERTRQARGPVQCWPRRLEVPKKLLHESLPKPTNYQGIQKPHFPQLPSAYDLNVIGDGAFFPDVSPFITEHILPEKKKGRSASFYPIDNSLLRPPVDEAPRMVFNSSVEPVGKVSTEMALLSNMLAAYSFITENPERAALYFVSGVCIGLILTLVALVLRISCQTDCKRSTVKKTPRKPESDSDSSDSDDNSDTTSDLSARRHRRFERTLNMNVFTSAEELERAQRLEERERIIREIWMNGQPDIPGTRSLNRYY